MSERGSEWSEKKFIDSNPGCSEDTLCLTSGHEWFHKMIYYNRLIFCVNHAHHPPLSCMITHHMCIILLYITNIILFFVLKWQQSMLLKASWLGNTIYCVTCYCIVKIWNNCRKLIHTAFSSCCLSLSSAAFSEHMLARVHAVICSFFH